ncbi:MFS transporter [Mycolicibacterium sp. S2-37]|uniref:MFS transporter n=1 Tax=Mycolicibacterium sp. S2-37 TaxID=2810297 RepID=UPI001A93F5B5|nr:MFS transporter [Mycolicibacterium sp. S2-37]MBO0678755.1 MFS transporter [Mycolicibacterium sp. S2-37]
MAADTTGETRTAAPTISSRKKSLIASSVGNVLEWYEWSAYAVFAPFIAAAMFSQSDPVSALLSTLAVFAVGFLMRPLGGIVFGRIADKRGRKFVLVTTMLMMATGSLLIGIMPTYGAIGAWASALLLVARMMQGFAHGGESATAYSYVGEIAPPNRRGMWGSVAFIAIFGGSVLAYTVGGVITTTLTESAVGQWGWRIPFLLGSLLALFALYLRRSMDESDVFDADQHQQVDRPSVPRKTVVRAILLMIGMTSGVTAAHYTWTSYVSTYAITQQDMDPDVAYWMLVIAQVVALVSLPFLGRLSDSIGRRPMLAGFAVLMFVLQIPLTMLISSEGWTLLLATTVALLVVAGPGAILSSTLSESFPTHLRTQSIGFAYSFSVAVFGGTAPYLNQLFLGWDLGWVFGVYIMFLAALTGVACFFMKETKGVRLEDV